jgi:integrase
MRSKGSGGLIPPRKGVTDFWYATTFHRGKQHRRSTGHTSKLRAEAFLRTWLAELDGGAAPVSSDTRYAHIRELYLNHYREQGKKSLRQNSLTGEDYVCGLKWLDKFWGLGKDSARLKDITAEEIVKFKKERKEAGAKNGTVNRALAALTKMFTLGVDAGLVKHTPLMKMLPEASPRSGFIEHEQFLRLLAALPQQYRAFVLLLYTTGVRTGEAKKITWNQVNLDERIIRLEGKQTKNADARSLPLVDVLVQMLKDVPEKEGVVFPVGNFRKAWNNACVKAGLGTKTEGVYEGLIFHDLRRSAIRNFVRVGVTQTVAMSISGHKTVSTFIRYNITDERDKHAAMAKIGTKMEQILLEEKAG